MKISIQIQFKFGLKFLDELQFESQFQFMNWNSENWPMNCTNYSSLNNLKKLTLKSVLANFSTTLTHFDITLKIPRIMWYFSGNRSCTDSLKNIRKFRFMKVSCKTSLNSASFGTFLRRRDGHKFCKFFICVSWRFGFFCKIW